MVEKNDTNESNINQQKEKNEAEAETETKTESENYLVTNENDSKTTQEPQPQTSKNGLQVKNREIPAKLNSKDDLVSIPISEEFATTEMDIETNENLEILDKSEKRLIQPELPVNSEKPLHSIGDLPHQPRKFSFKRQKIGGQTRGFKAKYFDDFKWLDFDENGITKC